MGNNKITVSILLKNTTRVKQNDWRCTILGEKRSVPCQKVDYIIDSWEELPKSFDPDEVAFLSIKWNNPTAINEALRSQDFIAGGM